MDKQIEQLYQLLQRHATPKTIKLLSLLGLFVVALKALRALRSLSRTFITIGHNLPQRYGAGTWAVITGGASGIGAAFAHELSAKGFNLVLMDLNEQNLQTTASAIKTKHSSVEVKTVQCNFMDSFKEGFYDSLMKEMEGLEISILINNVGWGDSILPFYQNSEQGIWTTMIVNMVPMTILCRRIMPLMLKRTKKSAIINLASVTGVHPASRLAVYSSTKAYVDTFSRMIEEDVRHKIDVMSLRPDAVSTPLILSPTLGSYVVSPESVAKAALKKIGKKLYTHGHWRHEIKVWLANGGYLSKLWEYHFAKVVLRLPHSVIFPNMDPI